MCWGEMGRGEPEVRHLNEAPCLFCRLRVNDEGHKVRGRSLVVK